MVNKYANPETVLGFAYRVSPRSSGGIGLLQSAPGADSPRYTVSACNKLDYLVCSLSPIVNLYLYNGSARHANNSHFLIIHYFPVF